MDKHRSFDIWLDKRLCEMEAIGIDEAFYAGWQSRQAEVDEANAKSQMCRDEKTHAINRWSQIRKEVEEKDKRINQALNFINNWWHPDLDQKLFVEALGRALRGEHE